MFHMVRIEGVVVCKAIRELDIDGREASLHQFQIDQQAPGAAIAVPNLNKSQILFHFIILLLKFAQIDEVIQRLCTPPKIIMSTVNGTGTARTSFEIVNGSGLYNVSTNLTLDCISENCH